MESGGATRNHDRKYHPMDKDDRIILEVFSDYV